MAEMKPTPVQNPKAMLLAKALRAAKDFGNKAQIPEGMPLLGGQGVGDMILGQAPEEIENWGYGNYPFAIPEMSNIPVMKTGRHEGVFDAMSMAPVGAGGSVAAEAGTLPFKLKHKKKNLVHSWVEGGVYPYEELGRNTPKTMETLAKKADKLQRPTKLHRIAHDPEEVERLTNLGKGQLYSPGRLMSTSYDDWALRDINDTFQGVDKKRVLITAPKGSAIGGDLGPGNENFYNEFLVRPDATFVRENTPGTSGGTVRLRALTESEANLAKRKAMLKAMREKDSPT